MGVIMRGEMHDEPTPPLKQARGTTLEEPTNNINEESDLEEETIVVKEEEKAILKFPQIIEPSIIKLEIGFTRTLKTNINGFYIGNCTIKDKKSILLSSHFEPTAARQAFPCFDQPDMKATFNIKITHSKELTCLSNMSVKTEEINENFKTVFFNQKPKMSTYLVAFAIGNLEFIETESKNGRINRLGCLDIFFSEDVEASMSYDSLQSKNAIVVPVFNPNDINQIFDGISYFKGASLIRMLENYVGRENFKNAIQNYLEKILISKCNDE
ncbi:aminopeptidase [Hamiltosporidium magnivora]|uniref:Aminopeptidase n=1 Tax=Hamiltosporidium magnivora TaxID=148818 RepID=A0A4Q9LDR9_9MICR|nr:aminopeptidase [Hamiltosporidium magnivora]